MSVLDRVRIARLSIRIFGNAQTGWRNKLVDTIYESKEYILDEYKDMTRLIFINKQILYYLFQ